MEENKRIYLNAYELLLIKTILNIRFDLKDRKLSKDDYREIGEQFAIRDPSTIAKLFNDSYRENVPMLRRANLDTFAQTFLLEGISSWADFIDNYPATDAGREKREFIPIAHFSDLTDPWKARIAKDVNVSIAKLFPKANLTDVLIEDTDFDDVAEISPKMEKFLNTSWHIYFIINQSRTLKIGRSVLRIGNTPKQVETEAVNTYGLNDFSGSIEFDKSESFFVLNLKAKDTQERWVHLKGDVSTGRLPQIIIGQYQNIGIGGVSLIFSNVVFERINDNEKDKAAARIYDGSDPHFSEVPEAIKQYLFDIKLNYAETSPQIYSLDDLTKHVESSEFKDKLRPKYLRLRKNFLAFISRPSRALTADRRKEYTSVFNDVSDYLDTYNFEVYQEPLRDIKTDIGPVFLPEFHLQSVQSCDLFILLYFDEVVSNALTELAWAYQAGKHIFILTSKDKILPSVYKEEDRVIIQPLDDIHKATEYFKQVFPFYAKSRFPGFKKHE